MMMLPKFSQARALRPAARHALLGAALAGLLGCQPQLAPAAAAAAGPAAPTQQDIQARCEQQLPATKVVVTVVDAHILELNDESVRTLSQSHAANHPGTFTFGLTTRGFSLAMASGLSSLTMPTLNVSCSRPDLEVTLTMQFHRVSVARELRPGSCLYDEVRGHEYRHVQLNRNTLVWAAKVIEKEMKEHFGNQVYYGDPYAVQAEFQEAVRTYWLPRLKQLDDQGMALHAQIDTPEEYARLGQVCNSETRRIIQADEVLRARVPVFTRS